MIRMAPACQIGPLVVGSVPAVVGVLARAGTLAQARSLSPRCDLIEVRVDLTGDVPPNQLASFAPTAPPRVLTIRTAREGGRWTGSEEARVARYLELIPYVDAVDIELESDAFAPVQKAAHAADRRVIGSFHDFTATPEEERLRALVARGAAGGADIVKIAAWTAVEEDIRRLESLFRERPPLPLAVMGMGPLGIDSRLRLAMAGSCLVYGYLDEATAPGQLPAAEWIERLSDLLPAYRAAHAHA